VFKFGLKKNEVLIFNRHSNSDISEDYRKFLAVLLGIDINFKMQIAVYSQNMLQKMKIRFL
jgi:hypothetical protein